jgi:nitronate monooxygenase
MHGMRSLHTRFTQAFDLRTPIALAPMALASGGALAAACVRGGALGLVGGGYGELAWTQREYQRALDCTPVESRHRLGLGFITWKLDEDASALDWALNLPADHRPRTVMLSFGDPRPYAARIAQSGAQLLCQVQRLSQVDQALEAGAQVIVAQGTEAGGHGANALEGRATFTLVPEIADHLAHHAPQTLLLAAGGIADGRGLAAALTLGADGALVGSRLWASAESLAAPGAVAAALAASGDDTARSAVFDILRRKNWPAPYDFRALRNALHRQWEQRIADLRSDPQAARADYDAGVAAGDFSRAHATVGEAVGLISDAPAAQELLARMTHDARARLAQVSGWLGS